ncbi:MAG: hypothetical protein IPM24_02245 [Bryobacterales bacterium]|nr:hypothetical protein [Bryobacterales bacterium]
MSSAGEIRTVREFEAFLRNHGFSRKAAARIASVGWRGRDEAADEEQLAAWLQAEAARLAS